MKRTLLAALAAVCLAACGKAHYYVDKQPGDLGKLKQVAVGSVVVASKEDNPDARDLNRQWQLSLTDSLQTLLRDKGRAGKGKARVEARVDIVYGSQALRYWVGFGAGAGSIKIVLQLKDAGGNVVYATRSESDLGAGWFGGDMKETIRKTINGAVQDFGSRL